MWNDLSTRINDFLDAVTLEQLIVDFQQGDATVTPISSAKKVSRAA